MCIELVVSGGSAGIVGAPVALTGVSGGGVDPFITDIVPRMMTNYA